MKKKYSVIPACCFIVIVLIQSACISHHDKTKAAPNESRPAYKKPISNYQDSLQVDIPAAVFYHPDSLQLLSIKAITDSNVYDGTMHEFFFQMRNARIVIKKNMPALRIIEAKHFRYLVFHKRDGSKEVIDLDTRNDAYGLFIFNQKKSPLLVDMTNIETELGFYFTK